MATSSTYDYAPSAGDFTISAFARIGLRPAELTAQHWFDASNEANLLQVHFSNLQPNLFCAETYEVPLLEGTSNYVLPARFVSPMAVYMTTDQGNGSSYDRILGGISTFEWAALPDKTTQAPPTTYWFDRLNPPQMNVWPVPNADDTYILKLRILSQAQDVKMAGGVQPQMPFRWYDAWVAALAHRLARIYKPEMEAARKADAADAWQIAATQDTEFVPTFFIPMTGGYYR